MFEFFRRLLGRERNSDRQNGEAKAWLDDLRRNELSMSARQRIAPDEPMHGPRLGHGAAEAVSVASFIPAAGPEEKPGKPGASPCYVDSSPADSAETASGECSNDSGDASSCSDSGGSD
jgi:hypothetical protein